MPWWFADAGLHSDVKNYKLPMQGSPAAITEWGCELLCLIFAMSITVNLRLCMSNARTELRQWTSWAFACDIVSVLSGAA